MNRQNRMKSKEETVEMKKATDGTDKRTKKRTKRTPRNFVLKPVRTKANSTSTQFSEEKTEDTEIIKPKSFHNMPNARAWLQF